MPRFEKLCFGLMFAALLAVLAFSLWTVFELPAYGDKTIPQRVEKSLRLADVRTVFFYRQCLDDPRPPDLADCVSIEYRAEVQWRSRDETGETVREGRSTVVLSPAAKSTLATVFRDEILAPLNVQLGLEPPP